jgi:hypothetical protein
MKKRKISPQEDSFLILCFYSLYGKTWRPTYRTFICFQPDERSDISTLSESSRLPGEECKCKKAQGEVDLASQRHVMRTYRMWGANLDIFLIADLDWGLYRAKRRSPMTSALCARWKENWVSPRAGMYSYIVAKRKILPLPTNEDITGCITGESRSISGRGWRFSIHRRLKTGFTAHPASYQMCMVGTLSGVKRSGHEANHWPSSGADY